MYRERYRSNQTEKKINSKQDTFPRNIINLFWRKKKFSWDKIIFFTQQEFTLAARIFGFLNLFMSQKSSFYKDYKYVINEKKVLICKV